MTDTLDEKTPPEPILTDAGRGMRSPPPRSRHMYACSRILRVTGMLVDDLGARALSFVQDRLSLAIRLAGVGVAVPVDPTVGWRTACV